MPESLNGHSCLPVPRMVVLVRLLYVSDSEAGVMLQGVKRFMPEELPDVAYRKLRGSRSDHAGNRPISSNSWV